jgi:hypothetical protein
MAQSPDQMEQAGILKPGSAALIAKLVSDGKTVEEAMTSNLFTGMPGAENLKTYISNTSAQCAAQVNTFQKAQTALTQQGVITGNEAGSQIAGLVMSASTAGISDTVNFVKNAANSAIGVVTGAVANSAGAATGALNNVLGSASSLVSAGNFAGNLASTVTGGLSSIAGSLGGMAKGAVAGIAGLLDSAKGVAGSAFSAITGAFPTLQAGVPQNIKDITEKAQSSAQAPSSNTLSGALGSVTGAISGAIGAVTGGITGAVASVTGAATGLLKTTLGTTANLSTGLGALPGGASVVASVVNNAVGAVNTIPGVSAVTGLIGQATSITNGISSLAVNPLASSNVLNAATGVAGALTKGLGDLKSGNLSLSSLASAGLPAGAAAQLNAAISSMSSGGAVQIKLPTVAINTTDRSELTAQVTSLLGNPKIPAPNFAGASEDTYKAGLSKIDAKKEKYKEIDAKLEALNEESKTVRAQYNASAETYENANNNLPAGDPSVRAAYETSQQYRSQLIALQTKGYELLNERNRI